MNLIQKLKALIAVSRAVDQIQEANKMDGVKPGWKTTEFWGKVAVQVFTVFGTVKGFISPEKGALIAAILEGVYGIARSVVKYKGGSLPDVPAA